MFLQIPRIAFINLDKVSELSMSEDTGRVSIEISFTDERDEDGFAIKTIYGLRGYKSTADAEHALRLAFGGLFYKSERLLRFPTAEEYYGNLLNDETNKEGT